MSDTATENYKSVCESLEIENKVLKKSRDKLLSELKEVENTSILPDGDEINVSTAFWLEDLIKIAEAQ